ncbi:MAG: phosphatase PAP2 family protein [Candidatus Thermoplasmatota archaeon]|nr:phosphatase PAP2 family protein [Candidatus Thermoplasmatota archaeon]
MRAIFLLVAGNLMLSLVGMLYFRENRTPNKLKNFELTNYFFFGILFILISLIHITETKIDPVVTSKFSLDFTRTIYCLEGDIVGFFQSWSNPLLDYYMVFIYMFGFTFLLYFTPVLYIFSKDLKALKLAITIYGIIIAVAIPFYLFFPVNDVWWASQNYSWYQGRAVAFRLQQIWPGVTDNFFAFTTLNNCFPSLHCSISMAMAATAWIRNYKKFAVAASIIAMSIPLATLYLGIHWFTDVVAGELLALAAVLLAVRIVGE